VVTSVIALGILGFVATALWPHLSSGTDQEIARGKEIFAILGSIVGTIVGFYFGAKAGEDVAKGAVERATNVKLVGANELTDVQRMFADYRSTVAPSAGAAPAATRSLDDIEQRLALAADRVRRA